MVGSSGCEKQVELKQSNLLHLPATEMLLQNSRTTDLQSFRTNSRPFAPKETGWISTQKIYRKLGRIGYTKH